MLVLDRHARRERSDQRRDLRRPEAARVDDALRRDAALVGHDRADAVALDFDGADFDARDRLQRALALAEKAAFTTEGFLKWLNRIRPTGEPALTEIPLTAESVAKAAAQAFRQRVEWCGGG